MPSAEPAGGDSATIPPQSVNEAESASAAPDRSAIVEFLVAVVPASGGAAMAYHLAERQSQDPITWAALGGAIGLLLGWACLLWIGRDD